MAECEMRDESLDSDGDAKRSWCFSGYNNSDKNQVMPSSSSNLQVSVSPNKGNNTADMFSDVPVFPEEIWEMILNEVQDSESIQNVLLAFPKFPNTFERNIPLWLFELVFPHLLPRLTKLEVRRCIQVCMTWRRAISRFAEDHPSRRPYNDKLESASITTGYSSPSVAKIPDIFDTKFDMIKSINKFIQISPSLQMNPFIGRHVCLNYHPFTIYIQEVRASFEDFRTKAELLLQKHGKHIWYFKICSYVSLESGSQFYEWLKLSLSLMPNLRSLYVERDQDTGLEKYELPRKPLPPLPSLESLTLDWPGQPGKIFLAFVRSYVNEGLRFLSIQSACWTDEVMGELRTNPDVTLSRLTELHVNSVHFLINTRNFMNLVPFLSRDHLQKLTISGIYPESTRTYFRALDGFNKLRVLETSWLRSWNKLRYRSMCLSEYGKQDTCKTTTLDKVNGIKLPALHVLRVQHEWWLSYRFLTWIASPVNLEITADGKDRRSIGYDVCYYDEITQELHKWICQESTTLNKSLIWNLVPGLQSLKLIYKKWKMVDVTVYTYRRADCLS